MIEIEEKDDNLFYRSNIATGRLNLFGVLIVLLGVLVWGSVGTAILILILVLTAWIGGAFAEHSHFCFDPISRCINGRRQRFTKVDHFSVRLQDLTAVLIEEKHVVTTMYRIALVTSAGVIPLSASYIPDENVIEFGKKIDEWLWKNDVNAPLTLQGFGEN